jgi:signal peptidase I
VSKLLWSSQPAGEAVRRGAGWLGGRALLVVTSLIASLLPACRATETFTVMMQDSSMEPTYTARTLVRFRPAAEAQRGQVIAFEYPFPYPGRPRRVLIARVIGLPGDELELGPEGILANGRPLPEPYVKHQERVAPAQVLVPPGTYYVLGDDRNNQRDSRWWGPLPAAKLLGVATSERDP